MTKRLIYTGIVAILVILGFGWISIGLVLLGIILFSRYYEGLGLVVVADTLFGLPGDGWLNHQFSLSIIMLVIFVLIEQYKKSLLFYQTR